MPASFPLSNPARSRRFLSARYAVVALAVALAACGKTESSGQPQAAPPPQVGVVTITPGTVGLQTELPGRLEASRVAEVRARAAGILQKRLFREGSDVKAGQTLFQIDDAPYRASLESAQASVAQAEATLAQNKAQADRYKPLVAVNAVSKQDYDNAVAAQKTAEANVAAARAAVTTARINLGYAAVTSPISGRVGRALVTEGALVGQGDATQLAVVQQIDPLYVNFTQSASDALRLQRGVASGQYKRAADGSTPVKVVLDDGTEYDQPGKLLFSDLTVDATSGQVTLRAEVPNASRLLLPGMYVRVKLEQAQVDGAVLLPQQAVTRSAQGDIVKVVGAENKLEDRKIRLGPAQGANWVVLGGLNAGEKVMVDGFQKLPQGAPGQPVTVDPVAWQAQQGGAAGQGQPGAGAAAKPPSNGGGDAPAGQQ